MTELGRRLTLQEWWRSLERSPEPLASRERWMLIGATLVAAVSRWFALARTPWDWDEVLFMLSLDHFNVAQHRPHPPGFPLYVLAAKVIRKFGFGDFHALQALSFLGAIAIVPAMFFLCRELRMRFSTSLSAAMLLAFFPNVWFYGGGAFSDVPSMTLVILALALLFAGCRNPNAYFAGSIVLAISAGFRPQNLLIGFVPILIASMFQFRRSIARVIGALAALVAIIAVSYLAAAYLTGWHDYREAVHLHQAYIARVDSFLSPTRPPLWRVFDDFFVMPYRAPVINAIIAGLCLIALARARVQSLVVVATFGVFSLASWLMLDHFSASRFSIGYVPMIAILAADGLQFVTRRLELIGTAVVVAVMIAWTWPALSVVRPSIAPPVAAVDWIRNHVDRQTATIYVDETMVPYARWYLPDYTLRFIEDKEPPPSWAARKPGYYVRENVSTSPRAENFMRPRGRLWDLARHRYFEASVKPITDLVVFGKGWYWEEGEGTEAWRWMGSHGEVRLPPLAGDARLTFNVYVPLDALHTPPDIVVRLNGKVVDAFRATRAFSTREIVVRARADGPNLLVIDTDRVITPAA
ncbi:MAG: hypothetical protein M3041_02875, partial [Acidobacteriota bacterium]|nr:hypothetical protein [Acidobacteriota bacterium]